MSFLEEPLDPYEARNLAATMAPFRKIVEDKIWHRVGLRNAKNWTEADAIREELTSYGFLLEEDKHGTMIRIKDSDYMWYVITNLKALALMNSDASGFVPHEGPPIDLEAEAEWYRQKERANESN